jgi:WD40 repeat protein
MSTMAVPPLSPARPTRVFGAHPLHTDGDLVALGFSQDGTLWSVEEPGVVRGWNVASRRQTAWHSLDDVATVWAFNWASRLAAAGSDELTVWEIHTGTSLAGWPHSSWVTAIAFQPGFPVLATGDDDGVVRLWEWTTRRLLHELRGHDKAVSALAFSGDGTRLASAGEDKVIRLWDVAGGQPAGTLAGHPDRIPSLAWHPDGVRLYSAGWDTTARVWDTRTCEPIILLNSHAAQVYTLALSPDGRLLACADSASSLHLWDTSSNRPLAVLRDQPGEVRCLGFNFHGQLLAWGGTDHVVHLWDAQPGSDGDSAAAPLLSRNALAVSPDGARLASLGGGTSLRVWEVAGGDPVVEPDGAPVLRAFAASPDGRWFAASQASPEPAEETSPSLALWDSATGKRRAVLEGQQAPITALAFSPDSATLASGGFQSSDIWLWDVPAGTPALLIPDAAPDCAVEALAFHPRGRLLAVGGIDWLATSGSDGQVALWDLHERRQALTLPGGVTALAFHPEGHHLAAASLEQSVRVWDIRDGRLVGELLGHLGGVTGVAYSPDGKVLASGGDDRTVRLWDPATGEPLGAVELETQVKALAFSPDGKSLFTGNGNTSCYQLEVEQILAE